MAGASGRVLRVVAGAARVVPAAARRMKRNVEACVLMVCWGLKGID